MLNIVCVCILDRVYAHIYSPLLLMSTLAYIRSDYWFRTLASKMENSVRECLPLPENNECEWHLVAKMMSHAMFAQNQIKRSAKPFYRTGHGCKRRRATSNFMSLAQNFIRLMRLMRSLAITSNFRCEKFRTKFFEPIKFCDVEPSWMRDFSLGASFMEI